MVQYMIWSWTSLLRYTHTHFACLYLVIRGKRRLSGMTVAFLPPPGLRTKPYSLSNTCWVSRWLSPDCSKFSIILGCAKVSIALPFKVCENDCKFELGNVTILQGVYCIYLVKLCFLLKHLSFKLEFSFTVPDIPFLHQVYLLTKFEALEINIEDLYTKTKLECIEMCESLVESLARKQCWHKAKLLAQTCSITKYENWSVEQVQ